jgi:hypothetical protein
MRSRPLLVNKERAELMCQPDREYSLVCNVERNFSDQVRRQKRLQKVVPFSPFNRWLQF